MSDQAATIFARASGAGRAAIAVMRISGAATADILVQLCGAVPPPRQAVLRSLRAPADAGERDLLDRALVVWFPGPRSYTGEDGAELHLHAGPAVVEAVADALVALGARPAEPGEFTRRAFSNGRLDLVQAEAIADLVEAVTQAQRRQALRQAGGALSRLAGAWAVRLRQMLAAQEALIDFPDEDLPPEVEAGLVEGIDLLADAIRAQLRQGDAAQRVRSGLWFAVTGAPNVGKSSLVNRLARRDASIVSDRPGTTRDVIEVRLELAGVPVTLVDTAGLRETEDPVEAEGVRRARARAEQADLVILVADSLMAGGIVPGAGTLPVWNKLDRAAAPPGWLGVSALTGDGMETLRGALTEHALRLTQVGAAPPLSRARHVAALTEVATHLQRARAQTMTELRGEELRLAMRALGRLTGFVEVEDLLDTVFGEFCIGK